MVKPSCRRSVVKHLQTAYVVSERRACGATGFLQRSSQRYRTRRDPQTELRMRLKELAVARVRYGYRRLDVLLRREGWPVNAKRVYRLRNEEELSMRTKTPRWALPVRPAGDRRHNDCSAMDFMSDALFDGRPFRILAVVDCHSREALMVVARANFRAFQVVEVLDRLAHERGMEASLQLRSPPYCPWEPDPQAVYRASLTSRRVA